MKLSTCLIIIGIILLSATYSCKSEKKAKHENVEVPEMKVSDVEGMKKETVQFPLTGCIDGNSRCLPN